MSALVHAVLLAAGRSSRTGASHKLLATFDDEPLIRRSARTALASRAAGVSVVIGCRGEAMRAALAGLPVRIVRNARFAEGLSTSLIAGLAHVPASAEGVLIMLADQPALIAGDLDRLIDAFVPEGQGSFVVATDEGHWFNPVVFSCRYRDEIKELTGDVGAKMLLRRHKAVVAEVELGRTASFDVDTIEAILRAGGVPEAG